MTGSSGATEHELWIVHSVNETITVLVLLEEALDPIVVEVSPELLPDDLEEGCVLRVPLGSVGEPRWDQAERDADVERELDSPS